MIGSRNSNDLARELRRRIDGGEWEAGARLPPERLLAEKFAVARNTVRRALNQLESAGYLSRHVGRGTFIQMRSAPPPQPQAHLMRMREASPRDILETRLIIEPRAAALAASRASTTDLAEISEALGQNLAAASFEEFERWDAQLHLSIFVACKNDVLIDYCHAICQARNQPQWSHLKRRSVTPESRASYDAHHRGIVAALVERNPEAAADRMREHLCGVQAHMVAVA